jgi:hypothetical protein
LLLGAAVVAEVDRVAEVAAQEDLEQVQGIP